MAKFCMYCGKPIEEGTRFCPACGKPMAAQPASEPIPAPAAESAPQLNAAVSEAAPAPQPKPAAEVRPAKSANWVLIGAAAVICAVLALVVVLVLKDKDAGGQPQEPQGQWTDIPGFSPDDIDSVAYALLPECTLLSYDRIYYNEGEASVYIYGCRMQAPEGSLLDLSEMTVDMRVDMSDPEKQMCSFSGFDGIPKLKTGELYTINDISVNEIEVMYEAQPYVSGGGYGLMFPDVFIADLTIMDMLGISDPGMSRDMWFDISGEGSTFPYMLQSEEGDYTIYLNECFKPVFYGTTNY